MGRTAVAAGQYSDIGAAYQPDPKLAAWHQARLDGIVALQAVGQKLRTV